MTEERVNRDLLEMGKSLDQSLHNVFRLSRILGLMPLRQDSIGFSRSVLGCVVSVLHVGIMAIGTAWLVFIKSPIIEHPFFQILSKTQFCLLLAHMIACIICPLLSVGQLNEIVDDLRCSDIFLSNFGVVLDDSVCVKFTFFYALLLLVLYFFDVSSIGEGYLGTAYYYWFFLIYHVLELQVTGLLEIILSRFMSVLTTLRRLWHDDRNTSQEVVKLTHIHRLLSKSARKANEVFSLQVLLISAITFVRAVVDFYCVFRDFNVKGISKNIVLFGWILTAVIIFYRLIKRTSNIRKKVI